MAVQKTYDILPDVAAPGVIDERNPFNMSSFILFGKTEEQKKQLADMTEEEAAISEKKLHVPFGVFVKKSGYKDSHISSLHTSLLDNEIILVGVACKSLDKKQDDDMQGIYNENQEIEDVMFVHNDYDQLSVIRQGYVYVYCESERWEENDPVYVKYKFDQIEEEYDTYYPIGSVLSNGYESTHVLPIIQARFCDSSVHAKEYNGRRIAKIYIDMSILPRQILDEDFTKLEIDISEFDRIWQDIKKYDSTSVSPYSIVNKLLEGTIDQIDRGSDTVKKNIYHLRDEINNFKINIKSLMNNFNQLNNNAHRLEIITLLEKEITKYSQDKKTTRTKFITDLKNAKASFEQIKSDNELSDLSLIFTPLFNTEVSWNFYWLVEYIEDLKATQLSDNNYIVKEIGPHLSKYKKELTKIINNKDKSGKSVNDHSQDYAEHIVLFKRNYDAFTKYIKEVENDIHEEDLL